MITTFIAILLLVIFFSFFLKVKFVRQKKKNLDDVSEFSSDITNDGVSSLDISLLKQMKLHFFRFADLVLLEKRPFSAVSINDADETANNNLLSSNGDNTTSYNFEQNYSTKTLDSNVENPQVCYELCNGDPTGQCNAWKYSNNNECSRYIINNKPNLSNPDGSTYGYIRRSPDHWAIKDESGLPSSKDFFKSTAKLVTKLGGAPRLLKSRSERILANENVQYCYRDNPISGENDNLILKFREVKAEAMKDLEKVCDYFLFMGNNGLANSAQYIEYAVLCTNILAEFKNGDGSDIFPTEFIGANQAYGDCNNADGIFTDEFCEVIKVAFKFFHDYSISRDVLTELFFNEELNTDYDGFVTKDELFNYIYNLRIQDQGEQDCEEVRNQVKDEVQHLFEIADENKDNKISFSEFESAYYKNIMNNKPTRPEKQCNGNTEWSYNQDASNYNPTSDRKFDINQTNNLFDIL